MDEPTVGLDPKQIIEIRDLISRLGKNHTVILSSHILSEIQAVCDRIIIINGGRLVADGTPDELSKASVRDLRLLGLGFRDSRVFETTKMVKNKDHHGKRACFVVYIVICSKSFALKKRGEMWYNFFART